MAFTRRLPPGGDYWNFQIAADNRHRNRAFCSRPNSARIPLVICEALPRRKSANLDSASVVQTRTGGGAILKIATDEEKFPRWGNFVKSPPTCSIALNFSSLDGARSARPNRGR